MASYPSSSSSSFDSYPPPFDYNYHQYCDPCEEQEDEGFASDSYESATLLGSDTEYKCESESDSEANSSKKITSKSKTKRKTNDDADHASAQSKKKSCSSTAVAKAKQPREKSETNGGLLGDGSNTKKKKKKLSWSSAAARIWSERDEIVLLKGIISFLKKFKTFDGRKFYNSIEKHIEADVSTAQTVDKVRRLKEKYRKKEAKRGPNGEDPVFSKPHELNLFKLSEKAWGSTTTGHNDVHVMPNTGTNANISDGIAEGADAEKIADHKLQQKEDDDNPTYTFEDDLVMEAFAKYVASQGIDLRCIGQEKLESLENKWRKIKVSESTFRLLQAKFDAKVNGLALCFYKFFDY